MLRVSYSNQISTNDQDLGAVTCVFVDNHVAGGVDTFVRLLLPRLSDSSKKLLLMVNQTYPDLGRLKASCKNNVTVAVYSSVFQHSWFTRIGVTRRGRIAEKLIAAVRRLSEYLILPVEVFRVRRNLSLPPESTVLVINGGYPGSYAAIAASLAFSKHNAVAMNIHNLAVPRTSASWLTDWLIDWIVRRRVRVFIGVSHTSDNALKSRFSPQSVCSAVVYNAIEPTSTRERDSLPDERANPKPIVLGLIGTLEHRKGHFFAVRLLAHLREAIPSKSFLLQFIGSDPYHLQTELVKFAKSHNVLDSIEFSGYRASQIEMYSNLDFALVPSTALESFGLVAIEAVAAGVHVLSSSAGALPEILEGLPNCTVLPSLDVDDWVTQIENLLPNLWHRNQQVLGQVASHPRLQRFLSPDQMAKEYIAILRSLSK